MFRTIVPTILVFVWSLVTASAYALPIDSSYQITEGEVALSKPHCFGFAECHGDRQKLSGRLDLHVELFTPHVWTVEIANASVEVDGAPSGFQLPTYRARLLGDEFHGNGDPCSLFNLMGISGSCWSNGIFFGGFSGTISSSGEVHINGVIPVEPNGVLLGQSFFFDLTAARVTVRPNAVPLPPTVMLMMLGGLLVLLSRLRKARVNSVSLGSLADGRPL